MGFTPRTISSAYGWQMVSAFIESPSVPSETPATSAVLRSVRRGLALRVPPVDRADRAEQRVDRPVAEDGDVEVLAEQDGPPLRVPGLPAARPSHAPPPITTTPP